MKGTPGQLTLHSRSFGEEPANDQRGNVLIDSKSLGKDLDVTNPLRHATDLTPALIESACIASVARHAPADPATDEVIVIDDSSIDETVASASQAGARVIRSSMLGKGASMVDSLAVARVVLINLDGAITCNYFIDEIATATGQTVGLSKLREATKSGPEGALQVAKLFQLVPRQQFLHVAGEMVIRTGAIECINRLRRAGYIVGLLSDNYFVAAEVIRRRVFADFALAHTLQFNGDVCTGQLRINPAFLSEKEIGRGNICKSHIVSRMRHDRSAPKVSEIYAVSTVDSDFELLKSADHAFLLDPVLREKPAHARFTRIRSLTELADLLVDGDIAS